jgi:hypothetical protein
MTRGALSLGLAVAVLFISTYHRPSNAQGAALQPGEVLAAQRVDQAFQALLAPALPSGPLMEQLKVRIFERLGAAQEKEPENDDNPPARVKDTKPHDICAAYRAHRVDYIRNGHRYWHCQR